MTTNSGIQNSTTMMRNQCVEFVLDICWKRSMTRARSIGTTNYDDLVMSAGAIHELFETGKRSRPVKVFNSWM